MEYARVESALTAVIAPARRPVAVAFLDRPPAGVSALAGSQPSSCSFWRLAAAGQVFYTVPSDHYNCPIGSYAHNIPLPPEREQELPQMLAQMTGIGYIRMEEVPGVPRLPATPAVAVYAPLGETPVPPDVVVVAGSPGKLMLLQEAAIRAGQEMAALLGRPTCMAIPAALSSGTASSLGCVGNRIYTDLAEDEFYTVIAGRAIGAVVEQLSTITAANATLTGFHRERRATLATA